ncbi:MAG: reductive dehalogenase domain-containing protein [Candidatus Latescibacterota bacterium]
MPVLNLITIVCGTAVLVTMLYVCIVSVREHERRAAAISLWCAAWIPSLYVFVALIDFKYQDTFAYVLLSFTAITPAILLIPVKRRIHMADDTPRVRIDERDTMFSRYYTAEHDPHLIHYYEQNPDKKILDDKFRCKAGLLEKGSKHYDPLAFSAANASFKAVTAFHGILDDGPAAGNPHRVQAKEITRFLKNWAVKLGAMSAGVTQLKDYHLYSVVGRGDLYGTPVELDHTYAIAVTVEMDKRMIGTAPLAPTVMESSQQYLSCGAIAVQIAEFIHNLGYEARAHIDGNYRVVCPLVARDAGLGEIGRMGLLMTPQLGPRVRIAVVTTNLPLSCDNIQRDGSVIEFCKQCKKCAVACPSKAIAFGGMERIDGVERWQISSEACFTIWCSYGTDCGRCVSVCPYSHPDNFLHNMIRRGVRNSALFRSLALALDDVFYGKNPPPADVPSWIPSVESHGEERPAHHLAQH